MNQKLVYAAVGPGVIALLLGVGSMNETPPLSLTVVGGDLTLTIDSAIAGSQPQSVTNTATRLDWATNGSENTFKITVFTACPGQSFSLYLVTTGVVEGTAQPERTLTDGMAAVDLVREIGKNITGTGTLQYRAEATVAQGTSATNGDDIHTVTFTLTAQ